MKKLIHPAHRSLALLLCLTLCASLLLGLGVGSAAADTAGAAGHASALPEDESVGGELPTLWDRNVTVEAVQLPASAFIEPDARLSGLSADGKKALISFCSESYLYDLETGEKTYLVPGDEQTEEALRLLLTASFRNLPAEEAAKRAEDVEKLKGRELAKQGLSVGVPGRIGVRAMDLPGSDGSWMLVNDPGSGMMMLLDTRSGEFYSRVEGGYLDARGDQLMAVGPRPESKLLLVDRNTGKETPAFAMQKGYGVVTAAFLPDGGAAAVLRELKMDVEHGEDCLVLLRGADGMTQSIELGKIRFGMEPDEIMCLGEDRLLLRSRQYESLASCMVDRRSGEVSLLTLQKGSVTPIPASFDDTGRPEPLPDGMDRLFLIAALRDGKTVLLQGKDSICYLYRPETGETRMLLLGLGWNRLPLIVLSNYTYNGFDQLWMNAAPRNEDWSNLYFQLHVTG